MSLTVHPSPEFFDQIDSYLPAERGSDGKLSRSDFMSFVLFPAIEYIAEQWENLPYIYEGRTDYRVAWYSSHGVIMSVEAQQISGSRVVLHSIQIDLAPLPDPDEHD